ncbi:MAG TPA: DinB family protein [Pyrinomonadaceae bacterium]|jgi:uncharacterized damage-inducible protein DinB|nr:DinB family protein [Pyrinomonadaceae bacterium]
MKSLMRPLQLICLTALIVICAQAQQQPSPAQTTSAKPAASANPLSNDIKGLYTMVKGYVMRAAEKMPEDQYSFKPTPEVRSFGQVVGHIADAQYLFCAPIRGEKNPEPNVEKNKTSKADLVQALKDGFAYCDSVYDGMTDQQAAQMVSFFGRDRTKLGLLAFNSSHNHEHYGNLVTYMRLKNLVPPSSEGSR